MMKRQNFKSDFSIIVTRPITTGVPFTLEFFTSRSNTYNANFDGVRYENCRPIGDDQIEVFFDHHKLSTGELMMQVHYSVLDDNYTDGYRNTYRTVTCGVILGNFESDGDGPITVDLLKEYIKGEPFRYEDFTPQQLEKLRGPKGNPFTYNDFTPEQLEALKGPKGEEMTWEQMTTAQKEALKESCVSEVADLMVTSDEIDNITDIV